MKTLERIISKINDAMMWVAGILAILMGLAITYDINHTSHSHIIPFVT